MPGVALIGEIGVIEVAVGGYSVADYALLGIIPERVSSNSSSDQKYCRPLLAEYCLESLIIMVGSRFSLILFS